ncbi:MAG TPA: hypothetical protein VK617_14685 [Gemmatimonadaceae bacterium]|nr:hypothetical protein [Gemmatimonadaceae bacterium]
MHLSTRLFFAAAIVATIAACGGSSTGPDGGGGHTPGTLAQHFDTLYQHAKASSVSDANFTFRAQALSNLELGAAFGAAPTTITVTTSSGTEQWKGFVFEELHDSSGVVDSATFIVAYRDSLVHTMVLSGFLANGTSLGSFLLANDTLGISSSSRTQSASLTSVGSSCPAPISGLVNPIIAAGETTTCTSAQFDAALALGFPATTGVDAALTAVSFPTTSIAGERFVDAGTPGSRVGLASLLRRRLKTNY